MDRASMLAMAYITVEGASPSEEIEAAAAAGFTAIGLRAQGPTGRSMPSPLVGDRRRIAAITGALRASGLALLGVEVLTLADTFDRRQAEALIETAAQLGAHYLQVVCEDPDLDRAADRLAWLAQIARRASLALALEFMAFRTVDSLARARRVAERANVPILVDALHLIRSGGTAADLAAIPADDIAFFQLCDAPAMPSQDLIREARFDRLYPGEGALPLDAILAALPRDVPISVEVPRATMSGRPPIDRAREAMRWTRRFLDRQTPLDKDGRW